MTNKNREKLIRAAMRRARAHGLRIYRRAYFVADNREKLAGCCPIGAIALAKRQQLPSYRDSHSTEPWNKACLELGCNSQWLAAFLNGVDGVPTRIRPAAYWLGRKIGKRLPDAPAT